MWDICKSSVCELYTLEALRYMFIILRFVLSLSPLLIYTLTVEMTLHRTMISFGWGKVLKGLGNMTESCVITFLRIQQISERSGQKLRKVRVEMERQKGKTYLVWRQSPKIGIQTSEFSSTLNIYERGGCDKKLFNTLK